MGIAGLWQQQKLHFVLFLVFQPHAQGVLTGGAIAGDALGVAHPGDHTFPWHDQDAVGFVVDVADFAALAVEAHGVGFGGLVDARDHSVYIGTEWENA
ncbi:hypothetical protein D3C77_298760 [compost metagenome]